jgi:hypothetical protein
MPAIASRNRSRALPNLLIITALALLIAIYVRLWVGLLGLPALGGTDYISFYTAGRIARSGAYRQLYDLKLQYAIQSPIIGPNFVPGGVMVSVHPPFLAPLLGLISFDDYRAAYITWCVVLVAVLALCGWVVARFLGERGFDRRASLLGAAGALLFYPVFISLLKGQDSAFVLLGALVWMWALLARRERLAGAALALALLKPQIGLALALPLLASRNRSAWWFCGTSAALGLYSLLMVGWGGVLDLVGLMRLSSDGWGYGINQQAMYNFLGLLVRGAPGMGSATLSALKWALYVLTIALLCWLWWGRREALTIEHIGVAVVLCVFSSPHLHLHDLSLLLLPALGVIVRLAQSGRRAAALALLPVVSLVLFANDLVSGPLHYVAGYVLMLGLGMALGVAIRYQRAPRPATQEA